MAQTKAMVIYDILTVEVRRIIVAEDDAHYNAHHIQTLQDGEDYCYIHFDLTADPQFRHSLDKAREAVARATFRQPPSK